MIQLQLFVTIFYIVKGKKQEDLVLEKLLTRKLGSFQFKMEIKLLPLKSLFKMIPQAVALKSVLI